MPNLIIIIGPSAVGKSTIGKLLSNKLAYKLLYSQIEYELVSNFFPLRSRNFNILSNQIKLLIIDHISTSSIDGLIFTTAVDFSTSLYLGYFEKFIDKYIQSGGETFIIELYAEQNLRIERNKNPNRSLLKPLKANVEEAEKILLEMDKRMKLNSMGNAMNLFKKSKYLFLDTSEMDEFETYSVICKKFNFK